MNPTTTLRLYRAYGINHGLPPLADGVAIPSHVNKAIEAIRDGFDVDAKSVFIPRIACDRTNAWGLWWADEGTIYLYSSAHLSALAPPCNPPKGYTPLQLNSILVVSAAAYTFVDVYYNAQNVERTHADPDGFPAPAWMQGKAVRLPSDPADRRRLILTGKPKPEVPF